MYSKNMEKKLDSILRPNGQDEEATRFYQLIRVDNTEHFLELRFRDGIRCAFAYDKMFWFNYAPDASGMELDFMGTTVVVTGRGLSELIQPLKSRRISWLKEADTDLQDHEGNTVFINEIYIIPPQSDFEKAQPESNP